VLCDCCGSDPKAPRVPATDYHVCRRQRGLIPRVIERIINRRVVHKKRKQVENDMHDQRQKVLKWVLVTCLDGDTIVRKYSDSNGDGVADGLLGTYSLSDLQPLWEGGKKLALRTSASRKIYTYIDDDGDGSIDEDPDEDWNKDGKDGIAGYDDDDDGLIDEGDDKDEDEDGTKNEDPAEPIIFYVEEGTLREKHPVYDVNVLAHNVAEFRAQYILGTEGEPHIDITLALSRGKGIEITLNRQVHMENLLQRQGMSL